jgi:hypothetical protein
VGDSFVTERIIGTRFTAEVVAEMEVGLAGSVKTRQIWKPTLPGMPVPAMDAANQAGRLSMVDSLSKHGRYGNLPYHVCRYRQGTPAIM